MTKTANIGGAKLDPRRTPDWQIAAAAEANMKTVYQLGEEMGVEKMELLPYGHYVAKLDFLRILERLRDRPNGYYIDMTAITPTPLGEGKSTTTMGLVQGLGRIGKRVSAAIRQPSSGPTFNIKGSAAGGGLSQCIPLSDFSLGLTGDIDALNNAHNLAMVAATSRLQHEFNYGDDTLARKKLKRLNIDPRNPAMGWTIDFCAQALREIVIGIGGKMDGFMLRSGFQITVSSEVMSILVVASNLKDLRERMGQIVVAFDKSGKPVTTSDLEVDGAMTALIYRAINPNLMQTIEGQPVLVHGGPFANISIGQSSVIADRLGLKLSDYHITESGFGADIGFEKFWNLKCRLSGLTPACAVIVATVRALKMHGGGPKVTPGTPLDRAYTEPNPALVEKGLANLMHHVETVKKSHVAPIVCINHFHTDSDEEVALIRRAAAAEGVPVAVSKHWEMGGEGAMELAEAVAEVCEANKRPQFRLLYEDDLPIKDKIARIATEVYGADGVTYAAIAEAKIKELQADETLNRYGICTAKTHLSLSHDPALKGCPRDWHLPVRDVLVYRGARLIVPVAGDISLMPGTASDPAFRRIDVDVETGKVKGLF
ncbi:MAG: formate--tetrahydrofolate ligase [Candidatus Sumerlaeota bacterium]|nr:formate--tetrahydrofolate ligase [Candidatus Sumerlaeota bacterium]